MGYYGGLQIEIGGANRDRKQAIIDALADWAHPDRWTSGKEKNENEAQYVWMEYDEEQTMGIRHGRLQRDDGGRGQRDADH